MLPRCVAGAVDWHLSDGFLAARRGVGLTGGPGGNVNSHRPRGSALGCPSGSAVKPLVSAAPPPQPLERVDPGFVGASFSASTRCHSVLLLSLPLPALQGRPVNVHRKGLKRLVTAPGCCVLEKQNSGVRARRQSRAGGGARGQGAVNRAAGARAMCCLPAAPGLFELTSCERAGGHLSQAPDSLVGSSARGRPPSPCRCVGRCCGCCVFVSCFCASPPVPSCPLGPRAPVAPLSWCRVRSVAVLGRPQHTGTPAGWTCPGHGVLWVYWPKDPCFKTESVSFLGDERGESHARWLGSEGPPGLAGPPRPLRPPGWTLGVRGSWTCGVL